MGDKTHNHKNIHSPEGKHSVLNRLSRAIGHLEYVKRMVESDRDYSEVLIQLSAVRAALTSVGKVIMQSHIEHCIVQAVSDNEPERINELKKAIDKFIK